MEEMLEDTLEMDEDEEITEEADAEVDKVLFELTNGKLGQAGMVGTELPVSGFQEHWLRMEYLCPSSLCRTSWRTKRQRGQWNNTDNSLMAY